MKVRASLICSASLLVSACSGPAQDEVDVSTPVPTVAASTARNYSCDSGESLAAAYPTTDAAMVQYQGSNYAMQIATSASGARYVGGGLEWWTKGSGPGSAGTLFRHRADGSSGDIIESCIEY